MSDINDLLEKSVTIYKITETYNDRGDVTKATSSTISTKAEIQIMSGDEREVRAGILKVEDAIGIFKPDEDLEIGDEVVYDGTKYIVVGKFKESLGTTPSHIEVHLQKIVD